MVLKTELWVVLNSLWLLSIPATMTSVSETQKSGVIGVSGSDALVCDKLSNMEIVRSDFAMETEMDSGWMLGTQSARGNSAASTNPLNSLRNIGTELR